MQNVVFNPSPDELRAARDFLLSAREDQHTPELGRSYPMVASTGLKARLRRIREEDQPGRMRSAG